MHHCRRQTRVLGQEKRPRRTSPVWHRRGHTPPGPLSSLFSEGIRLSRHEGNHSALLGSLGSLLSLGKWREGPEVQPQGSEEPKPRVGGGGGAWEISRVSSGEKTNPEAPPPCQLPPTCACALHLTVVRTNCSWPGVCLDGLITFH